MENKPISLRDIEAIANLPYLSFFEKILLFPRLNQILNKLPNTTELSILIESFLQELHIETVCDNISLAKIPAKKPLIVVSNHPYGLIDGFILTHSLLRKRQDIKMIAHYLLKLLAPFANHLIGIDPNKKQKLNGMQESKNWLMQGGTLCIFPAGRVSYWHWKSMSITDQKWKSALSYLITDTKATVIPAYVHGRNSWYFQLAGVFSKVFQAFLLPQQVFAKSHSKIQVTFGDPIQFAEINQLKTPEAQMAYLQKKSYALAKTKAQAENLTI